MNQLPPIICGMQTHNGICRRPSLHDGGHAPIDHDMLELGPRVATAIDNENHDYGGYRYGRVMSISLRG